MCVTCQKFDIFELGWEEHCTQILTQNQKNISKKDGKRRNYENAINPYFMWLLACYETWRKTHIGRPISNKIPSPRWAVTKVAVHLPFARSPEASTCGACATHRERTQPCLHEAVSFLYVCACACGTCIRRGARHRRTRSVRRVRARGHFDMPGFYPWKIPWKSSYPWQRVHIRLVIVRR